MLEKFASFGGTWLTHTYPGIRSDSDLYTFGYRFKPWIGPPIATADEILSYMGEVIEENDLGRHIRYNHAIASAEWSSDDNLWTLHGTRTDPVTGTTAPITFTTNFLWMCQGYYRHEKGYTPDWPGMDRYQGRIVHPQTWPSDIDLSGKQVLVIGSGATAATLVPAIAGECEHVTMLQRSPTYFVSRPNVNEVADMLRDLEVPEEWTHEIVRRKALKDQAIDHPALVGSTRARTRRADPTRHRGTPGGLRRREALHPEVPTLAAASRNGSRRRPVQGHQQRQGVGRDRRDRDVQRDGHPHEVR